MRAILAAGLPVLTALGLCLGGAAAALAQKTAVEAKPAATRPAAQPASTRGDGPAWVLNGFVLKEQAQCRQPDPQERRACCERLLHPNACR
ncbi:MAG: hypothetical protein AB7F36_05900 [Reyranellaceae bacterium]